MKGYRLHDQRIAFSNGTGSMRSIKYPLMDTPETAGLCNEVAHAITHDYCTLYGPLNFDDYLANKDRLSLVDFWLKALSLGFIFAEKGKITERALKYMGKSTPTDNVFDALPANLKHIIDRNKFGLFLLRHKRPSGKSAERIVKTIIDELLIDIKNEDHRRLLADIVRRIADRVIAGGDQMIIKCEEFDVAVPEVPESTEGLGIFFAIDPHFPANDFEVADRTELLERLDRYYSDRCVADMELFLGIGGTSGAYASNMLSLISDVYQYDARQYAERIGKVYDFSNAEVETVRKRIEQLQVYGSRIPQQPLLVDSWQKYCSDFSSHVTSWWSNRKRNHERTLEQLDGKVDRKTGEVVGGLGELLRSISNALPAGNDIKKGILARTIVFVHGHDRRISRAFTDELESYLATLRSDLNEWSQSNPEHKLPRGWQKELSTRVQSSPLFFGENKYALWEQLVNLKFLIRTEIERLEEMVARKFEDYEVRDRQVEMLARLFVRIKDDGNRDIIARLKRIESELRTDFSQYDQWHLYNVHGYGNFQRSNLEKLRKNQLTYTGMSVSRLLELADLSDLYEEVKSIPQEDCILRDTVQISQVVVSALVHGSDMERESVLIHSRLRGHASLIARREFIVRSTLQALNGKQLRLGVRDGRYFYAFLPDKFSQRDEVQLFHKTYNFSRADLEEQSTTAPILAVRSSKYQVQFLDWFMGLHSRKKTNLGAGGAFSIAEKTIQLDWSGETPQVVKTSDVQVLVSQPFEIKPRGDGRQVADNRFIGVDMGMYGLAWSLIETHADEVRQLEDGLIVDLQQQNLMVTVKEAREKRIRATFGSPDRRVTRILNSLTNSYRNQLENLAMRNNARLSFEYEVSSFGSGGKEISKVYDAVKRADIRKKENNAANKMAWGDRGVANWGFETTAQGTSQFCTQCKRWSSLGIDDTRDYVLKKYTDGLYAADIGEYRTGRALKTSKYKAIEVRLLATQAPGSKVKGRELKGMIYKAMRPNAVGFGMAIVKRQRDWNSLDGAFGTGKPRGNTAIFVCPYSDCHHIADADKQAAFNIAVRGAIKADELQRNDVKVKKQGYLNKEFLCARQAELSFQPVDL